MNIMYIMYKIRSFILLLEFGQFTNVLFLLHTVSLTFWTIISIKNKAIQI